MITAETIKTAWNNRERDAVVSAIVDRLNVIFAEMDEKVKLASREWGVRRAAAVREFHHSDEYNAMKNTHQRYERLFAIAGGKTWFNVFSGRNDAMIIEFMDKNTAATIATRNATIARKLEKAGVTEVISEEFATTKDGFDGVFVVKTDAGQKRVKINTIYAGGYNIQCLHLRVLISVK